MSMRFLRSAYFFGMIGCALAPLSYIQAKPSGFQLRSGDAKAPVQNSSGFLVIESSKNSVIDWENFSIDLSEHVRFDQLSNTYVLNRVLGKAESALLGKLSSNGAVYLVNPNGILIGKEACIDTAGFIASTLDLVGSDLSSKHFSGDSDKGIVNQGKIHCPAGDIFLIAKTVENSGSIEAPQGQHGLLSGFDVLIRPEKAPEVRIHIEETVDAEVLKDNPYALAIRHSGKALAKEVYLLAENGISEVSGTIVATKGENGGHVRVLADEVLLLGQAMIDVSGDQGGGEALFGGDYQGQNPEIKNAKHLFVEQGVIVRANAIEAGDGGKVIFWSDDATHFHGFVDNRGGSAGGDGGFVEVSGGYLNFQGLVDGTASVGKTGTVLLDPTDITISTGLDANGSFTTGVWTSTASTATINTTTLQTQLGSNNVTINTSTNSGGPFGNPGTITVSNSISWSSANSLTLVADATIAVNAAISCSSTGSVQMTANGTGAVGTGITVAANISTTSGNITLSGTSGTVAAASGISVTAGTISTTTGTISFTGVSNAASGAGLGVSLSGGSITTTSGGSIGIVGTGSNGGGTGSHGVNISGPVNTITTAIGNGPISITGTSRSGTSSSGVRISGSAAGCIVSGSGTITVTGTANSISATSDGVLIANSWSPATTGTVTLSGTSSPVANSGNGVHFAGGTYTGSGNLVIQNCTGSPNGRGWRHVAPLNNAGNITGTNIVGTGFGGQGLAINSTITSTGGSINITASSTGTASICHGMSILVGTGISTTGGGSITLNGTGGPSSTASFGLNIVGGSGAISTTTGSGNISITGTSSGSAVSPGLVISGGGVNVIRSTSGTITISGTSSATAAGSHGISIGAAWTPVTSGLVTLSGTGGGTGASHGVNIGATYIGVGDITFSNCLGGTGGGNGINVGASFTTTGTITATTSIQGNGSGGVGFASSNTFSTSGAAKSISITASATGTTGASHGISLTGGTLATSGGGSIALNGTGGASSTASHGVNITGGASTVSTTTGNGNIGITGTASAGASASVGVLISGSAAGVINSTTGTITVSGTSSATVAGSHGVSIAAAWTPATTSLVTLSGTGGTTGASHGVNIGATYIGVGDITFSNCLGGTGGGNGINVGASFTTTGTITATTNIQGNGSGGVGFASSSTFSTSGAAKTIAITASATGTTGASHGISLTGGTLATSGGGSITLNGTGGASSTASHGVNITGGASTVSTTTGSGSISITGTASAGASASVGVLIAGSAAGVVNSTLGTITVSGTSSATVAGSHGVSITAAWTPGTTALLSLSGTGGPTGASHGVAISANVTNTGAITINGTAGGGAGSFGNSFGGTVTTSAGVITILQSSLLTASTTIDSTNGGASSGGALITFSGGTATIDGGQALSLTAGTAGAITLGGAVGATTALTSLSATAATITQSSTVRTSTGNVTYIGPGTITISGNITTTANGAISITGPVTLGSAVAMNTSAGGGGNISFVGSTSTINGPQSLSVTSGTGAITFGGAVGGSSALTSLTATATGVGTITQSSTVRTSTGNVTYSSAGTITIGGDITTTTNGAISITGPVTLGSAISMTTNASGGGNIFFVGSSSTINGAQSLILNSGTGAISMGGAVGGTTPLTSLTATATGVGTITQSSTVRTSTGNVVYNSAGTITIGGDITTTSTGAISITGPVVLSGPVTMNTSAGNTNILFSGSGTTIDGAQSLTLTAGTGTITLGGAVGNTTPLTSLTATVTGAGSITQSSTVRTSTGNVTYSAGALGTVGITNNITTTANGAISITGPVSLLGNISMNTSAGGGGDISFVGSTSTINGPQSLSVTSGSGSITFGGAVGAGSALTSLSATATGAGTITQSSTVRTSTGNVTYNSAGTISISGNITTTANGSISITGPVSLGGPITMDTSAGGGANISFVGSTSTINGAQVLTLQAGTGIVSFGGAVGGSTPLTNLVFTSASLIQIGNNITVDGSNTLSFPFPVSLTGTSTITTNNASVGFSSTLNGGQALTIVGGSGTATFSSTVGNSTPLSSLNVTAATINQSSTVVTTGLVSYTGSTAININNNITTNSNGAISMTGPVTLGGSVTMNTSIGGGANITFAGTVNGTVAASQNLTLNAGSGLITFTSAVGNSIRLGDLSATASGATGVSIGANITAKSVTLTGSTAATLTGTSTISTAFDNGAIFFGGTINGTTPAAQNLTLSAGSGLITLTGVIGGSVRLGAFSATTSNATGVLIYADITAASFTLTTSTPATIAGSSTISTALDSGNISFGGTITGSAAYVENLTLNSNSPGVVTLSGNVGATPLGALTIGAGGGGLSVGSAVTSISSQSFTVAGTVPTTLANAGTLTITTNDDTLSFGGTIDGTVAGSQNLILNAGALGTVTLSGIVGGTTPLGSISISAKTTANAVNIGGNITANSFVISTASPATLTGSSVITASLAPGIVFGSTIDGTSPGAQALTLTAPNTITLSGNVGTTVRLGAFTISAGATGLSIGTGVTSIQANSFTVGGGVPTTLNNTALLTIDTSAFSSGFISFGGTITGAAADLQALTLTSNATGSVTLSGNVGATQLGAFTIGAGGGGLSVGSAVTSISAQSFTVAGTVPTTLANAGTLTITTNDDTLSFGGTINGTVAGSQNLTLNAGTLGAVTFGGVVGGTTRLGAINVSAKLTANAVNIGGNITANSFVIATVSPATLTASSIINTSAVSGLGIVFGSTIDGTVAGSQALTLTVNALDTMTLSGNVGATTRLGAVEITSPAAGLAIGSAVTSIQANSFQVDGTVPTTLSNAALLTIDTSAFTGGFISFGGAITGTLAGSQALTLTANGTGAVTLSGNVGLTRLGAFTIGSGSGGLSIGTGVTSIQANSVTVASAVPTTLNNTALLTVDTSAFAGGSIAFGGTITGAAAGSQPLTLLANGTGSVTLSGNVGATRLGALTIGSGGGGLSIGTGVTSIAANSFTVGGTVPTTLNNTALLTIDTSAFTGGSISFGGTITGAVAGNQALTLTANGSGAVTLSGNVGATRLGAIIIGAGSGGLSIGTGITSIQANSFTVAGTVPTTLNNTALLTINTSAFAGGGVSFGGTVDGATAAAQDLTLTVGTGQITFSQNVGTTTRLGDILCTSTSATGVSIAANITAKSLTLTAGTAATLLGSSSISTALDNGAIFFGGTVNGTVGAAQNLTLSAGSGLITFNDTVGVGTRLGAITATTTNATGVIIGPVIIAASLNLTGSTAATLAVSSSISTAIDNGAIFFGGTINGSVAAMQNLTVSAGSGLITLGGVVGGNVRPGDMTLSSTNATGVLITANVTAKSFTLTSGTAATLANSLSINTSNDPGVTAFGGTVNGAHDLTLQAGASTVTLSGAVGGSAPLTNLIFTSASLIQLGSNITVTGANPLNFPLGSPVSLIGVSNVITSNNANINFHDTVDGAAALTLVGGSGVATFDAAIGSLTPLASITATSATITQGANATTTGPVTYTGSTIININGNITTTSGAINMTGPVLLAAIPLTFDTTNGSPAGASISFSSTLNGGSDLTLRAGTSGAVTFGGVVGGGTALGDLTIASAKLTANAVNISGNITATAFVMSTASPVTLTGSSIIDTSSAAGLGIVFGSTIDGTTAGSQSLTLIVNAADTITLPGNIGATTRLGTLTIQGGAAGLIIGPQVASIRANAVTVGGTVPTTLQNIALLTIDTGSIAGGTISFGGTITGSAPNTQDLTLQAGGSGSVVLSGNVGAIPVGDLTIASGSGSLSLGTATSSISAQSFTVAGTVPTTLNHAGTLTVATNNDTISFGGTVNGVTSGAQDLTLAAGSGDIFLVGAVGGVTKLGDIIVQNADDVTTSSTIRALSFTQAGGTGTTTFNGSHNLDGDITLTGTNFIFNGAVLADHVVVTNAGFLTILSTAPMTLLSSFHQNGVGPVNLAGSIYTIASDIHFQSGVTLIGNTTLTAINIPAGDITFDSTINGGFGLTLSGDTISFGSTVGATTPLRQIQATGSLIETLGNHTVFSGPMVYQGQVVIGMATQFSNGGSNGTTFRVGTGDAIVGNYDLTIQALNTTIRVIGDVDLSGASGANSGNFVATGGGTVSFSGQILTQGGSSVPSGGSGGNVTLSSSGGPISLHNINASGGSGVIGGDAGSIIIQPASGYSGELPMGIIEINEDLSITLDGNLVTLGGAGGGANGGVLLSANRSSAATVATIVSGIAGNSISALGGSITMGSFEAMTALGSIALLGSSSLTLGDIVALENLTLTAPVINLLTHGDELLLDNNGVLYTSPALHFYSGGTYSQFGVLVPAGPLESGSLALAPDVFRPELIFNNSVILNFDTGPRPVPFVIPVEAKQAVMYELSVSSAQLSDMVPMYASGCPSLCSFTSTQCDDHYLGIFPTCETSCSSSYRLDHRDDCRRFVE